MHGLGSGEPRGASAGVGRRCARDRSAARAEARLWTPAGLWTTVGWGVKPLVAVAGVRAAYGAGAPCPGTAGGGGVRRAARSTPMTAPMSHTAKATDAMPPLQKPVRDRPATA
jgi:hypothetical protein